ncbi:MAG: acetylxylan esterase [Thermoguttaceae bacterium]|jgi:cephalosporin-C deacetylase-like acetyl esterase
MMRTLIAAICLWFLVVPAVAEELSVLPSQLDGAAPKEMMHAYLMRRAQAALDRREAEYEKLKTPEQVAAYQDRLRQFFVATLGGFPERTPLNAKVVAKQAFDDYRIEKVIYESQPHHFVTAVLYLPTSKPPYPGVLVPCGHSANGKGAETYQRVSILLAKNGLAALCYDPIDQGERSQQLNDKGKPCVGSCTLAHSLLNAGSLLLGRSAATYRVWDGMRSLDYLESRPEIDPKRLGCTGNSGGGTLTSYLMALDGRIQVAAPSCYLTNFRRLLETVRSQDGEQNLHAQIAQGMDHADYVLMRAPKPTLMCVATHDFFPIDGAWQTFRQAKRIYARLGFAERVDLVEADEKHGFTMPLRVGAVRWMRRWLLNTDDAITEPNFPILKDPEIQVTAEGQVMRLAGARSTYDLNRDLEAHLAEARQRFWRQTAKARALEEVRRLAGIRKLDELPAITCDKLGTLSRDGYRIDKLVLKPEPGIWLAALAFVPDKPNGEATLYLHGLGKHVDAAPGGPIERLVKQGQLVLAVDLRGLGETQGDGKNYGISNYLGQEWNDATLADMLATSYVAMRAEDTLGCIRFLAGSLANVPPRKVHLIAVGSVVPSALHAAALEPALFASVTLRGGLTSWSEVVRSPLVPHPLANIVHGALRVYDLPDLAAALPKEKLTVE